MSNFSEYLQHLIQDRDISISKLSRDSGVERTAIHKALSSGRILPYQAVELLDLSLKLSPKESKRFRRYYDQLFESETAGRARNIIDQLFTQLSDVLYLNGESYEWQRQPCDPRFEKKNLYKGYTEISLLLHFVVEEELKHMKPRIDLAVPSNVLAVRKCIEKIYCTRRELIISHIICLDTFETEKEYNIHNLEYLACLLPACMHSEGQYQVYYYYSNTVSGYTDPLPYFLVAHAGVICFSENCQTAIFLEEGEQIEYFRACFYNLKRSCRTLIEYMAEEGAAEKIFGKEDAKENYGSISVPFYISQVNPEKWISLFTRKNVVEFLDMGRMYRFTNGAKRMNGGKEIVNKDERLKWMHSFLESIRNDSAKGNVINDMMFRLPDYFGMVTSANNGTFLFDKKRNLVIRFQENGMCHAFYDWTVNFSNSECVYDKEKTVEILTEMLKKCEGEG